MRCSVEECARMIKGVESVGDGVLITRSLRR
ncbi:hypothetical protein LINGRAHAP2_LOCUS3449 [Linum grandiflorum]